MEMITERYQVVRTLRKTIFGKVVVAFDKEARVEVAVKMSSKLQLQQKKVAEDPKQELAFMQILSATKEKGHQYILKLLDQGHNAGWEWSVTEFASKGELFDIIANSPTREVKCAMQFFNQIALGVSCIHKNGISHLDLSLENILVCENDQIKICDFGLARSGQFFKKGAKMRGKLIYMAPEVFNCEAYDGFKADVWSTGVILFVLLVGVPPFNVPSASDARFKLLMTGIQGFKTLLGAWQVKHVPDDAIDLLSHMLCEAKCRFSMEQVLNHSWVSGKHPSECSRPHSMSEPSSDISEAPKISPSEQSERSKSVGSVPTPDLRSVSPDSGKVSENRIPLKDGGIER